MGRKMIIVSEDNDFIVSAKAFCENKGGTVQVYSPSEWERHSQTSGMAGRLAGGSQPLMAGSSPVNEGAKILQFPHGGAMGTKDSGTRVHTINELESEAIRNAIMSFNGNLTEAAKALGIGRATLYRKVKQYNIDPSQARRKKAA